MANSDIHNLTAASGAVAADEFEIQKVGEVTTKKVTLTQLTQVEATARAAQDDIIEAGAGLGTDGTFPAMANSWYLRAADFVTGVVDRGGAVANIVANLWGAIRMLDSKLYANSYAMSQTVRTESVAVSIAEVLACKAVPKTIIVNEATFAVECVSAVASLDYGSVKFEAGADDLVIRYKDGGATVFTFPNAFLEATADAIYHAVPVAGVVVIGKGLELYCASAPTGGNSTIRIDLLYRKYTV